MDFINNFNSSLRCFDYNNVIFINIIAAGRRAERVVGELEGGYCLLYSSGLAAVMAALYVLHPKKGYLFIMFIIDLNNILVAIEGGYFQTHSALKLYSQDTGTQSVKLYDPSVWDQLGKGDLVYLESPKNPTCEMDDIKEVNCCTYIGQS
jgi:cystathionine gamma-synthase